MDRAYKMPPAFAELPASNGGIRYVIKFTEDGKRKQLKCKVGECCCIQSGNRYCEHKIAALQEFQAFQEKHESMQQGKDFNIPIAELLDEYTQHVENSGDHEAGTQALVKRHLDIFWNFCEIKRQFYIQNLDEETLKDYVQYLKTVKFKRKQKKAKDGKPQPDRELNYSDSTININLRNIRTLLNYAVYKKYILENPLSGMGKPKQHKIIKPAPVKARNILTKQEIETLKANLTGQWLNIFLVYIYTGMRLSELVNLTWDKIQSEHIFIAEDKAIDFKPKYNISRRIVMLPQVAEAIESQRQYQKAKGINTPFVFSTITGTRYMRRNLDRFFKTAFKKHNIAGEFRNGLSIHCFRHTFITGLINAGKPVPVVQGIAGHRNMKTTMIYYHQCQKQQDTISDFEY